MGVDFNDVQEVCNDLEERLTTEGVDHEAAIKKHLTLMDTKLKYSVPDFQQGLNWFNVESPLSLQENLKGKIVVLDFFTYCCANCLHVLPDLEVLENTYSVEDGVAIVGVHSAKFENEKMSANILSAVLRYNIHHPVVNDLDSDLWTKLQIACWPTFVIIGPSGQFLYQFIGEGHRQKLLNFIKVAKNHYDEKKELTNHSLPIKLEKPPTTPLSFPGKVCVSTDGQTVVVADTGHHRILVLDNKGIVKHVIGCSERGNKDGSFHEAMFSSPQGVVLDGHSLYIADTDNHTLRMADLVKHTVQTLAGTGTQGQDKEGGKQGILQDISSPWGLCLGDGIGGGTNEILYIAMAGTHQIWAYFIKDGPWFKNKHYHAGTCIRLAGSGLEENKNNSYPDKASFAQPSGITYSRTLNCLFVADSESSSVRSVSLKEGAVKNVVGGDIDPKNLFAYGDVDGVGTKARLQHPLCVTMATDSGPLLVADSYNHKIKTIDIPSRTCTTLLGTGKPGYNKGDNLLQREINEPGGITVDQKNKRLYIADTNNHDIVVVEMESQNVYSLPFIFPEHSSSDIDQTDSESSRGMAGINIKLLIEPADGCHLNEEAPNSWTLFSDDEAIQTHLKSSGCPLKGDLSQDLSQVLTKVEPMSSPAVVSLKLDLFICEDSGVCKMAKQVLKETLASDTKELVFNVKIS